MSDTTPDGSAQNPTPRITQRVLGAALFGLLCGGYAQNAADRTIPAIISMVQKINLETAHGDYQDSSLYRTSVLLIATFIGAAAAGFLARRKGILAGILSGSPYILFVAYILFVSIAPQYFAALSRLPFADDLAGDASVQFQALLRLVLLTLAAFAGGFLGYRIYSPGLDLDLGQAKVTVFGVRWAHYFWILPLIYLAYLASVIIIAYAGVTVLLADLSFAWHPSLWFNFAWNWALPVGGILVWLAIWITCAGFVQFYEVMQYRRSDIGGWKKIGQVFLYGLCAPTLSYTLAALGADVAHAMPKPAEGDWKIAVGIAAIIIFIGTITSAISRIPAKARPHLPKV
jgi:hypothetical protein